MDTNDRQAIDQLFQKLGEVERRAAPRDAEAEALIRQRVAQQPVAPYYMAQTIVVQEQALEAAQQRIQQLEQQSRPSLFGGLFGGGQRAPVPQQRYQQRGYGQDQYGNGQQGYGRPAGGGFLAGAAQTALGVAGGVLIANAVTGMFDGGSEGAGADVGGDTGGDAGDGGGFDGGGDFGGEF